MKATSSIPVRGEPVRSWPEFQTCGFVRKSAAAVGRAGRPSGATKTKPARSDISAQPPPRMNCSPFPPAPCRPTTSGGGAAGS